MNEFFTSEEVITFEAEEQAWKELFDAYPCFGDFPNHDKCYALCPLCDVCRMTQSSGETTNE